MFTTYRVWSGTTCTSMAEAQRVGRQSGGALAQKSWRAHVARARRVAFRITFRYRQLSVDSNLGRATLEIFFQSCWFAAEILLSCSICAAFFQSCRKSSKLLEKSPGSPYFFKVAGFPKLLSIAIRPWAPWEFYFSASHPQAIAMGISPRACMYSTTASPSPPQQHSNQDNPKHHEETERRG